MIEGEDFFFFVSLFTLPFPFIKKSVTISKIYIYIYIYDIDLLSYTSKLVNVQEYIEKCNHKYSRIVQILLKYIKIKVFLVYQKKEKKVFLMAVLT